MSSKIGPPGSTRALLRRRPVLLVCVGLAAACALLSYRYWTGPDRLARTLASAIAESRFGDVYDVSTQPHLASPDYGKDRFVACMEALEAGAGPATIVDGPRVSVAEDEPNHRGYTVLLRFGNNPDKPELRLYFNLFRSPTGWLLDESGLFGALNVDGKARVAFRKTLLDAMTQSGIDRVSNNVNSTYFERSAVAAAVADGSQNNLWKFSGTMPDFRW